MADPEHSGGPTAAVIAYSCPHIVVTVVDKSEARVRSWQSRHLPIHEPCLSEIVRVARDGTSARQGNLFFSADCDRHIGHADVVFLAVNTPTKADGIGAGAATDISMFESAARSVALAAKPGTIIVEKSTVPCRTADMIKEILEFHRPGVPFEVLSNPEFLAEGTAMRDLLSPSRILIGSETSPEGLAAAGRLADVYANWVSRSSILTIDVWSSELAKLVANAMLAQRISSINTVSAICERTGANVDNVAQAIGLDPRLGPNFLQSGLGFGHETFYSESQMNFSISSYEARIDTTRANGDSSETGKPTGSLPVATALGGAIASAELPRGLCIGWSAMICFLIGGLSIW